jgi:Domain of unknown function (DUF4730)
MDTEKLILILALVAVFMLGGVEAKGWDAGDTIALIVGLLMAFVALFAGLGWYSRRGSASTEY